jgi:hypothetical protein
MPPRACGYARQSFSSLWRQQLRGLLGDLRRGLVDLGDELLELLAGDRIDLELRLLGIGDEGGSFMVSMKAVRSAAARSAGMPGGARNGRPITWRAKISLRTWRCLSVVANERNVRQIRVLMQRELHQNVELLLGDPRAVGRLHARPRPAAAALQFAAFHREPKSLAFEKYARADSSALAAA